MKRVFTLLFSAAALFGAVSCGESDDLGKDDVTTGGDSASYIYSLNCGTWGGNDGTLTRYNPETGEIVDDLFAEVNGYGLGDLAQDMIVFEDKIFFAMCGSDIIFVTDLDGKVITSFKKDAPYTKPRFFTSDDKYVYVSYQGGGVAKIDPESYEFTTATTAQVAEQMVVVDDKLYVTVPYNSSYEYFSDVAVYDTKTMTFEKNIEVATNPTLMQRDAAGNLYVIAMGDYRTSFSTLNKVNIASGDVEAINVTDYADSRTQCMAMGDDVLYVVAGEGFAGDYIAHGADIYAYDTTNGESKKFITDGTIIADIYNVSVNTTTGELYVGTAPKGTTGDLYVFNADGTLKDTYGIGYYYMKSLSILIEE